MLSRRRFLKMSTGAVAVTAAAAALPAIPKQLEALSRPLGILQPRGILTDIMYISLHTSEPGFYGRQDTHEIVYKGYRRIRVARSKDDWEVERNAIVNKNKIEFPSCLDLKTHYATYFGMGAYSAGQGVLLFYGQLTSFLSYNGLCISLGVTPVFDKRSIEITF